MKKKFKKKKKLMLIFVYKGPQRLLSASMSIWAESHKIFKCLALINQVLPRCFRSYGLWVANQIIKWVYISKSIDINQSISVNFVQSKRRFYPIFFFPIIHHNSKFSTHQKTVSYSNKWKLWHLYPEVVNGNLAT